MALHAAGFVGCIAKLGMALTFMLEHQRVQAVLGNDLPIGSEVAAVVELLDLLHVTLRALARRHQNRDVYIGAY